MSSVHDGTFTETDHFSPQTIAAEQFDVKDELFDGKADDPALEEKGDKS